MMPRPTNATFSSSAKATTSRCLDSQAVAGAQRARGLGRQLLAVEQIPTPGARLATIGAGRGVAAALGDQRVAHLVQGFQLADHAVAAAPAPGAARAAPQRVLHGSQR